MDTSQCVNGLTLVWPVLDLKEADGDGTTPTVYHFSLQRRILRLESALQIPAPQRHAFKLISLRQASQRVLQGEKLSEGETGRKSAWRAMDGAMVSVEALCLEWYTKQGWQGYHSENGILKTLVRSDFSSKKQQ